jgi:hypothetical protein
MHHAKAKQMISTPLAFPFLNVHHGGLLGPRLISFEVTPGDDDATLAATTSIARGLHHRKPPELDRLHIGAAWTNRLPIPPGFRQASRLDSPWKGEITPI